MSEHWVLDDKRAVRERWISVVTTWLRCNMMTTASYSNGSSTSRIAERMRSACSTAHDNDIETLPHMIKGFAVGMVSAKEYEGALRVVTLEKSEERLREYKEFDEGLREEEHEHERDKTTETHRMRVTTEEQDSRLQLASVRRAKERERVLRVAGERAMRRVKKRERVNVV
jgi:arginine utilization protein RocB